MAKKVIDRVVVPAKAIDVTALKNNLEDLIPVADLGTRLWVIEKQAYTIDLKRFAAQVALFADKLVAGVDITVADIVNMPHIIEEVRGDDEGSPTVPRHHFYSPMLVHASRDWPHKGVYNGVVALVGDTGSGKTTYLFKKLEPDVVLRYSEPQEDVDDLDMVCPVSSLASVLTASLVLSALGLRVAVDSLRGLVYGLKGNAMEGGAVATLFDVMVQFNNLFAEVGVTVVLVINPMLSDMSKADRLFARLEAVVAGGIHVIDRVAQVRTFRCDTGRVRFGADSEQLGAKERGHRDPAHTDVRAGGYTMMINMERLKEDESRDNIAAAMGASSQSNTSEQPRSSATFTL